MALKAASSSLSKAEYLACVGDSLAEKKAKGRQAQRHSCCSTAPTCDSEASTARARTALWLGCARSSLGDGPLGGLKRPRHVCCPHQMPRSATQAVSQRPDHTGDAGQEAAIKINQAQEPLKRLGVLWARELLQGLDMAGERRDA